MKNRILGFFIGLVLIPILMGICVIVFVLALTLPIIYFLTPDCIKWNNKKIFC